MLLLFKKDTTVNREKINMYYNQKLLVSFFFIKLQDGCNLTLNIHNDEFKEHSLFIEAKIDVKLDLTNIIEKLNLVLFSSIHTNDEFKKERNLVLKLFKKMILFLPKDMTVHDFFLIDKINYLYMNDIYGLNYALTNIDNGEMLVQLYATRNGEIFSENLYFFDKIEDISPLNTKNNFDYLIKKTYEQELIRDSYNSFLTNFIENEYLKQL